MFKLDHFGFLRVSGVDAVKFMKGYTTCDLDALDNQTVQMGAICNLQGRMLTSFLVIKDGSDLILRMHRDLVETTVVFLSKYIVFSKAELADISDVYTCYGSLELSANASVERSSTAYTIGLGNRTEYWQQSEPTESIEPEKTQWIDAEIAAGVAWVNQAITEALLPQNLNYHGLNAIDFQKGCYLGQEIVARLHYRGELKKRLHRLDGLLPVTSDQGTVVATGAKTSLVVLQNKGDEPFELILDDNRSVLAQPL